MACSVCFFVQFRTSCTRSLPGAGITHNRLDHPAAIINQESALQACLQVYLVGAFSITVQSPHVNNTEGSTVEMSRTVWKRVLPTSRDWNKNHRGFYYLTVGMELPSTPRGWDKMLRSVYYLTGDVGLPPLQGARTWCTEFFPILQWKLHPSIPWGAVIWSQWTSWSWATRNLCTELSFERYLHSKDSEKQR